MGQIQLDLESHAALVRCMRRFAARGRQLRQEREQQNAAGTSPDSTASVAAEMDVYHPSPLLSQPVKDR